MNNVAYLIELIKLDMRIDHTRENVRIQEYINRANISHRVDHGVSGEVAWLKPNEAYNIPFPDDLEYFISLSLPFCGKLITLTVNYDLPCNKPIDPCEFTTASDILKCKTVDPESFHTAFKIFPHYRSGQFVGELYTYYTGHNFAGYVYVDYERRLFRITGLPRIDLCLQYVAFKTLNPNTLLTERGINVLRNAVHYQYSLYGPYKDAQFAAIYKAEANEELSNLRISDFLAPMDEMLDNLIYSGVLFKH